MHPRIRVFQPAAEMTNVSASDQFRRARTIPMTSLPAFFVRMAVLLGATVAVLAVAVSLMGSTPI